MISILNLEPDRYSPQARAYLDKIGKVVDGPLTRESLIHQIPAYNVLIVRLYHHIDKEIIDSGKKLQVIISATTGLNHIDIDYVKKKNIDILSLKGEVEFLENIHATAEHTWVLLLALIRKVLQSVQSVKRGEWDRDVFKGRELHGKTLGIVGMGRIGKKIAKYGQAFGMNVITYTKGDYEPIRDVKRVDSLSILLENSDVVSIHVPLDLTTRMMFTDKEFSTMRRKALLINTSRGEIVDEKALMKAIKDGSISGAALDVVSNEEALKFQKSKIIEFAKKDDRLIITPHIGGATYESMEKTEIFMAKKLHNYFQIKLSSKQKRKRFV